MQWVNDTLALARFYSLYYNYRMLGSNTYSVCIRKAYSNKDYEMKKEKNNNSNVGSAGFGSWVFAIPMNIYTQNILCMCVRVDYLLLVCNIIIRLSSSNTRQTTLIIYLTCIFCVYGAFGGWVHVSHINIFQSILDTDVWEKYESTSTATNNIITTDSDGIFSRRIGL